MNKIRRLKIRRFRGFFDQELELGESLTVIAGQNGTQKSTLLGILSQPFTLSDNNPMKSERPLTGGNYRSGFGDKFKLSTVFDKASEHEWTVEYDEGGSIKNTAYESIHRDKKKGTIRFWKKGDDRKGGSYIEHPVIFLSLNRLFPIGEEKALSGDNGRLSEDEVKFVQERHNKILLLNDPIKEVAIISGSQKETLGVSTNYYDWQQNSAGQDNVGKIILAILSFKRLKENYNSDYKGGLLVVDELDATLFPAAQEKLIDFLRKFSSKLNVQVVFTTHSIEALEYVSNFIQKTKGSGFDKLIYLKRVDTGIKIFDDWTIGDIRNDLHVIATQVGKTSRIPVFF